MNLEAITYPIGRFAPPVEFNPVQRAAAIDAIAAVSDAMERAVAGLSDEQLDTPYRPGGWTVRQVVHHLAEANTHMYLRFRFALAQDNPPVAAFDENAWAATEDGRTAPVGPSLALLRAVNERWVSVLIRLQAEDFQRTFRHPEKGDTSLDRALALYSWHGTHHAAQLATLRDRMGW